MMTTPPHEPHPTNNLSESLSFRVFQEGQWKGPEVLGEARATCMTRLVREAIAYKNNPFWRRFFLPFLHRNSHVDGGPVVSSRNMQDAAPSGPVTLIGSGTWKHTGQEALADPASQGPAPFPGKALQ